MRVARGAKVAPKAIAGFASDRDARQAVNASEQTSGAIVAKGPAAGRSSGREWVSGRMTGASSQVEPCQSAACACSAGPPPDRGGFGRARLGQEPVPVQDGHVVGPTRGGVPAEQVVVVLAHLARPVMMADVVEVELRQRRMHDAEDQQGDPQATSVALSSRAAGPHSTSSEGSDSGRVQFNIIALPGAVVKPHASSRAGPPRTGADATGRMTPTRIEEGAVPGRDGGDIHRIASAYATPSRRRAEGPAATSLIGSAWLPWWRYTTGCTRPGSSPGRCPHRSPSARTQRQFGARSGHRACARTPAGRPRPPGVPVLRRSGSAGRSTGCGGRPGVRPPPGAKRSKR